MGCHGACANHTTMVGGFGREGLLPIRLFVIEA
ncbi:MAG: hypothetical protein QOF69_1801 [Solirubrobacteraceae bacterium]|nr:hypothetical protein [Solirubrobacteraceae bacterium]